MSFFVLLKLKTVKGVLKAAGLVVLVTRRKKNLQIHNQSKVLHSDSNPVPTKGENGREERKRDRCHLSPSITLSLHISCHCYTHTEFSHTNTSITSASYTHEHTRSTRSQAHTLSILTTDGRSPITFTNSSWFLGELARVNLTAWLSLLCKYPVCSQ